MAGKKDLREQIADNADLILGGTVLGVDPSSTSLGWAVYDKETYVDGGTKKYSGVSNVRLYKIHSDICAIIEKHCVDIIIIERLRPVNRPPNKSASGGYFGSSGSYTPVELLWSAGAVLSSAPLPFIEVSPQSWKVAAKAHNLAKNDANDAKAMVLRVIQLAKEGGE